jgi:hypothetical protein
MFNVIQKHALDPVSGAMFTKGFNRQVAATKLMDHKVSLEVAEEKRRAMSGPEVLARVTPKLFMPKGQIYLETQVVQSVAGPIGLQAYQAIYVPVATKDGQVMNAQNDYVLRMSKHELPP